MLPSQNFLEEWLQKNGMVNKVYAAECELNINTRITIMYR